MNNTSTINVYFVVSNELPMIGKELKCSIIDIDSNNTMLLMKKSLIPTCVDTIDKNLIKVETKENNAMYLVMVPLLQKGKIVFGKTSKIPYPAETFECKVLEFARNMLDFTLFLSDKVISDVSSVKKMGENTFAIISTENVYILKKD